MDLDHQNIQMDKWIHAAVKPEIRTFDASETWFENVKLAYIMPACMGSAYLKIPQVTYVSACNSTNISHVW